MGLLPPILVELKASASEFHSKMGDAQKELDNLASAGATKGEKFKAGLTSAFQGAGAAMAGLGGLLTAEAMKGEQAETTLATAVKNAGGSMEELEPKVKSLAGHMANFGHDDDDVALALARLTDATGNPTKALDQMGLVADIAARKHISLTDAANLVGKIDVGKGAKALSEFGIVASKTADLTKKLEAATKEHETAVDSQSKAQEKLRDITERLAGKTTLSVSEQQALRHAHEDVDAATKKVTESSIKLTATQGSMAGATDSVATNLDKLQGKVMGSAQAQSDTLAGKFASLKAHMENMAEAVGQKVGPALTIAGPLIMGMGSMLESNLIPNLAKGVVSAVTWSASMVASAATAAAGWVADMAVMVASSIASAAAMIAPFLPLIVTIGAIGIAAYELYTHWDTVWGFIKGIIEGVWNWIKDHWPLLLEILTGPVGIAVGQIIGHWDTIVSFVKGIPGKLAGVGEQMWGWIVDSLRAALNTMIDLWNSVDLKVPKVHIPGTDVDFGGFDLIPDFPKLATGGLVTGGGLAWLHPAEVIVPAAAAGAQGPGGFTWNGDLIAQTNASAADIADELVWAMKTAGR